MQCFPQTDKILRDVGQRYFTAHGGGRRSALVEPFFHRVFSQETGQTFVEYLTAVRIEAAKHLLTEGNSRMQSVSDYW